MEKKKKKKMSFAEYIGFEMFSLLLIAIVIFAAETRVTERAQLRNLRERLESLTETFNKSYEETLDLSNIYNTSQTDKAQSVAYYLDSTGIDGSVIKDELVQISQVDDIFVAADDYVDYVNNDVWIYHRATRQDGSKIVIKTSKEEIDRLLDNIYTQNKVISSIVNLKDLFFIVTTRDGEIVYYPDSSFIGKNITDLGIELSDLSLDNAKWLRLNNQRYYTSSIRNEHLGITISCGIGQTDMTRNSHIAVFILFALISVIYTIVVAYTYFTKQEKQMEHVSESTWRIPFEKKLVVFSLVGLILISGTTYYIQTLFNQYLHAVETTNEKNEIIASLEESSNSVKNLTEIYNQRYLNKAQSISYMLSKSPELRTKEHLKNLSEIHDLQYIMLFDKDGKETLSDSGIFGFEISEDPESQSYAFNVLKNGIPYVIQEAQPDDLTGEYHQFIGVAMENQQGDYDGFLQIAVSPKKLADVIEEASLENTLATTLSGSNDDILVIDSETKRVVYCSLGDMAGATAEEIGLTENQIKPRFFGDININEKRYYADAFSYQDKYIYIITDTALLYSGRLTMTLFASLITLINMAWFTFHVHDREVQNIVREFESNQYVDVRVASGATKRTQNIMTRMLRVPTDWKDKTPEEKTARIVRIVIGMIAIVIIVLFLMRDYLNIQDTIFGFISSNKWERGFNVFALTEVLSFVSLYILAMSLINRLMDLLIAYVSPRNETVLRLAKSFIHYVGFIMMLYYCLALFGFDSRSLLASAGILTLVVGLGAKDLITDILAGLFIIFEREFQVGDIIEVGGFKGRVIEIGIRTTRLINSRDDIKSISNRDLSNIINKTRRNSFVDIQLSVDINQDIVKIESLLREELPKVKELSKNIISGPVYSGIDEMDGRTMVLAIRTECYEQSRFEVRTLVNREIKRIFDDNGLMMGK